jgi:hypothetical protein
MSADMPALIPSPPRAVKKPWATTSLNFDDSSRQRTVSVTSLVILISGTVLSFLMRRLLEAMLTPNCGTTLVFGPASG